MRQHFVVGVWKVEQELSDSSYSWQNVEDRSNFFYFQILEKISMFMYRWSILEKRPLGEKKMGFER